MRTPFIFLLNAAFMLALSVSAVSQVAVPGQVVDVLDAKTVVITVAAGNVTVELQYIEVPPAGPMHDSIKKHLRQLVMGKQVQYVASQLSFDRTVGRLMSNNVDISQQMLRDGAAWHMPSELSGQDRTGFSEYNAFESAAKKEKRGIWSDPNLRPSWDESYVAPQKASVVNAAALNAAPSGYWSDPNPRLGNVGALQHGYNAATKHGYVGIPLLGVRDPNGVVNGYRTGVDLTYFYTEGNKGRSGYFVFTVVSEAARPRFARQNTLIGYVDGERFVISSPKRVVRKDGNTHRETLTYRVNRSTMERFANAGFVGLEIGDYPIVMLPGLQMILNNLLEVSK